MQRKSDGIRFSIIVPVLREAERINAFLHGLFDNHNKPFEIIVVDGDLAGSTIKEIDNDKVIKATSPVGRGQQMNAGAALARGEILLFLHADTILPAGALDRISDVLENPECVGGAFEIEYESSSPLMNFIAWRSNLRCRLTRIAYGDQGIFIRREYFERIGGYREYDLLEDVDLMRRIKRQGGKISILENRLKVSPRRWQKEGYFFCMIRNHIIILLYFFGVHPNRLARLYKS